MRGQGRSLADQWSEDLDLLREVRRLVFLSGAHRRQREARGHFLRPDRHDDAWRRNAADQADLRLLAVLRDVLYRRQNSQGQSGWSAERRLGDRQAAL